MRPIFAVRLFFILNQGITALEHLAVEGGEQLDFKK